MPSYALPEVSVTFSFVCPAFAAANLYRKEDYYMIKIAPSILSADFANLERDIHRIAAADYVHVHAQSLQSYLTLCDPMDSSLPGSSVHEILQATILEWVATPSPSGSFPPSDRTHISCISCRGRQILYH